MNNNDIQEGDKVVCIKNIIFGPGDGNYILHDQLPIKDQIYCVRKFFAWPGIDGGFALYLVGIYSKVNPLLGIEQGWAADCFRKIWGQNNVNKNVEVVSNKN